MDKKTEKSGAKRFILLIILIILIGLAFLAWRYVFCNNVNKTGFIYIPKNATYAEVKELIAAQGTVRNMESFDWYARRMDLDKNIRPGRYRVVPGMSNRQLVKMLKNGKEELVKLKINYTTRNKEQLIEKLSSKFDMDKTALEEFLENEAELDKRFGLNAVTVMTMIRPGTYEMSWATSIDEFFDKMKEEYKKFWNEARKRKAEEMNMTQSEVMILASIVQGESSIQSEQEKIAGVYINRLAKNMALQADPTVIFALNDFTIRRVSNDDLTIDSPYNTYRYKGLPPGPICFPSDQAVAAVLNYKKSDYLFFCAKPELNGYSDFSCTLDEHEKYAKAYREALTKKGIRR